MHNHLKLLLFFINIVVIVCSARAFAENLPVLCDTAREAARAAREIRKLSFRSKVACEVQSKEQVRAYLQNSVVAKIPAGRLMAEEFVYGIIGIIPEDYAYESGVINLYLQQIGAYYDTDRAHFVMADWISPQIQLGLAVHELTHALQDQYFNIDTFIDMDVESSDILLARTALVEGDATLVSLLWANQKGKEVGFIPEEQGTSFASSGDLEIPRSLSRLALFPYRAGLSFVRFLFKRGGFEEINRAYKKPPRSSEEILHHDKFGTTRPDFVEFTDSDVMIPGLGPEYYIAYRDTLGEFSINALFSMYEDNRITVERAAAGWGGDLVVLIQSQARSERFVVWKTSWDSVKDNQEFLSSFLKTLERRFQVDAIPPRSANWLPLRKNLELQIENEGEGTTFRFRVSR